MHSGPQLSEVLGKKALQSQVDLDWASEPPGELTNTQTAGLYPQSS